MSLLLEERGSLARLALVFWITTLSACCLAVVAAICAACVAPIPHDPAFVARYAVLDGFLYPGQPAKTTAFQACVLATPFLLGAGLFICRRIIPCLTPVALRRSLQLGLTLHLLFFATCLRPIFYYPKPPLWLAPRWLLVPLPFPPPGPAWEWIVCLLAASAFAFAVAAGIFQRREVQGIVLGLAFLGAPIEVYAPSQISNNTAFTYHLNAMMDALSQSVNGHHLLVDFPHI